MRLLRWSQFVVIFLLFSTACPAVTAESMTIIELDLDRMLSGDSPDHWPGHAGPRVGLVLSGGGARGLAQIGVLKVIEESVLHVDLVAGTSMGGIIGGLWAAGFSADSIEKLATSLEWSGFFSDKPKRSTLFQTQREEGEKHVLLLRFDGFTPTIPTALTAGQKLNSLLNSLSIEANYRCRHDFDRLRIPLRICAVDILTAKPVILDSGNLADALRATMAVPLAFTPLTVDSMMLMDGGLLRPIPVETARDAGAEFVIAVNTTSGLLPKEQISDPVDIANQTTTIMQLATRDRELRQADAVVTPDLGGHLATDFDDIEQLIAAGEKAMTDMLPAVLNGLDSIASIEAGIDSVCIDSMVVPEFLRSDSVIQALENKIRDYRFVSISDIRETASGILERGIAHRLKAELKVTNSANLLVFDGSRLMATDSVGWVGNETLPTAELEKAIRSFDKSNSYIDYLKDVSQCLQGTYRQHEYDLMEIDSVRYDSATGRTIFHISEGLVSRVMISGNDRTKGWVIRRSFSLKEGEPFNLEKAEKGMANIFSTGLFERVNFNVEYHAGMALVRIEVKEKKFNLVRLGAHYHDHYHAETFLDFADANVLGFSNELFFRVQYGEMRKRYSLHLKADRIFETYLTYHFAMYHNRLKRDRYEENKSIGFNRERYTGAMFAFGQQLSKLGTVTAEAHAVRIRIDLPAFSGLRHRSLRKLTLRSRIDNLDRHPFPMSGVAAEFYFDFASDVFGGEDKFKKIHFEWRAQIPISRVIGLQPSFAVGVADDELPVYEKFLLGGNRSLYGYRFNSLEGDKLFRGNLGVRLKLPYGFYMTPRYDLGNVWTRFEEIRFNTLRHSFGCELSYDSPIGPVSVSYGRADEGLDRAYIDVGYDF